MFLFVVFFHKKKVITRYGFLVEGFLKSLRTFFPQNGTSEVWNHSQYMAGLF